MGIPRTAQRPRGDTHGCFRLNGGQKSMLGLGCVSGVCVGGMCRGYVSGHVSGHVSGYVSEYISG